MKKVKKESKISRIIFWVLGVLFLFGGLIELGESILLAIILIICSLLIIPFFSNLIKEKLDFDINWKIKLALLFVIVISIGILAESSTEGISTQEEKEPTVKGQPKQVEPKQEFISESLRELHSKLFKGRMTDLQKEELWEEKYEGEYVNWEVFVKDIDKGWLGGYSVSITASPPSDYTFTNDAYVKIKKDRVDNLKEYSIGDKIKFQGKLDMYSDLLTVFYVEEGVVTGRASRTQTDNLPPDNELIVSCVASGIPYDTCVSAIEGRRY